jgi:hypothetical protein
MRDYWLTQELLKLTGWGFIAVTLIVLAMALWLPKRWWGKLLAAVAVLAVASIIPLKASKQVSQQQIKVDEYKQRYDVAKALFDERCKTAGEKIYKTVENVDGVLLLKLRSAGLEVKQEDQFWPDAGSPREYGGEDFVRSFLKFEYENEYSQPDGTTKTMMRPGERGQLNLNRRPNGSLLKNGYQYVDVKQPAGSFIRYRRTEERDSALTSDILKSKPSRYAIDFVNDTAPLDRQHWVAGTTIVITDTMTGEVIAERKSFAFEPGLGSDAGQRTPWLFAETCPSRREDEQRTVTRFFVDQILKPTQEK